MRILIVASYNKGHIAPFITEQAEALLKAGCEVEYFGVRGHGFSGYLKNYASLRKKIKSFGPDVIHAHYGLSGLLANLQRKIPVVTTYHGSDINVRSVLRLSKMSMRLSEWNIFVSQRNIDIAQPESNYSLMPCGVNLENFPVLDKDEVRNQLGWDQNKKIVLFAGAFDNEVKNPALAKETVSFLQDVELLELKGYSRQKVALLFNAVDCLLLTSNTEGSPQVVKEAMACGCPIVSVDVGDVKERIENVDGCFVAFSRNPKELSTLLGKALMFKGKSNGREKIVACGLENSSVAEKLMDIYRKIG